MMSREPRATRATITPLTPHSVESANEVGLLWDLFTDPNLFPPPAARLRLEDLQSV